VGVRAHIKPPILDPIHVLTSYRPSPSVRTPRAWQRTQSRININESTVMFQHLPGKELFQLLDTGDNTDCINRGDEPRSIWTRTLREILIVRVPFPRRVTVYEVPSGNTILQRYSNYIQKKHYSKWGSYKNPVRPPAVNAKPYLAATMSLPPFPDDVSTHPLLVVDYQKLVEDDPSEIDKFWRAATTLGFW